MRFPVSPRLSDSSSCNDFDKITQRECKAVCEIRFSLINLVIEAVIHSVIGAGLITRRGTVNPWKYLDLQRSQDKTRDKTTEQEISDARNKVELICDSLKFN